MWTPRSKWWCQWFSPKHNLLMFVWVLHQRNLDSSHTSSPYYHAPSSLGPAHGWLSFGSDLLKYPDNEDPENTPLKKLGHVRDCEYSHVKLNRPIRSPENGYFNTAEKKHTRSKTAVPRQNSSQSLILGYFEKAHLRTARVLGDYRSRDDTRKLEQVGDSNSRALYNIRDYIFSIMSFKHTLSGPLYFSPI